MALPSPQDPQSRRRNRWLLLFMLAFAVLAAMSATELVLRTSTSRTYGEDPSCAAESWDGRTPPGACRIETVTVLGGRRFMAGRNDPVFAIKARRETGKEVTIFVPELSSDHRAGMERWLEKVQVQPEACLVRVFASQAAELKTPLGAFDTANHPDHASRLGLALMTLGYATVVCLAAAIYRQKRAAAQERS